MLELTNEDARGNVRGRGLTHDVTMAPRPAFRAAESRPVRTQETFTGEIVGLLFEPVSSVSVEDVDEPLVEFVVHDVSGLVEEREPEVVVS